MKRSEVNKFYQKIKAYYPGFYIQDDSMEEWFKQLEPYDYVDLDNKLSQHLHGEYKDKPPMLHYLIKYLKTPSEKAQSKINDYNVNCNLCGDLMPLSKYDEHYDKCLSITALQRWLKNNGKEVSYKQLDELDDEAFSKVYSKYCEVHI